MGYYQRTIKEEISLLTFDPGFIMETDGKVVFHTFPKDQHPGPLRYTLFVQLIC